MDLNLAAVIIMGGWVVAMVAAGLAMVLRPGGAAIRLAPATAPASGVFGEREEILLGGEAEVLGNVRGRVQAVQLRPDSRQLRDVELAGDLGLEGRPVPATAILSADGQVLRLAERWAEPVLDGAETEAATLRQNVTVAGADRKRLGRLRLVCFDQASGTVTSLVVEGRGLPSRRLVPIDHVTEVGPDRVVTDLTAGEWMQLQPFATDWEIEQGVLERLTADSSLPGVERSVRIDVHDQRVQLQGYVEDRAQADRVAQLVRSVPGVLDAELNLVTDEDLARAVTDAIARDPATSAARVRVTAHLGTVDITGEAPDRATLKKIESVAGQVNGVQVLHNMVGIARSAAATS